MFISPNFLRKMYRDIHGIMDLLSFLNSNMDKIQRNFELVESSLNVMRGDVGRMKLTVDHLEKRTSRILTNVSSISRKQEEEDIAGKKRWGKTE